ncbi:FG-GAP-like repeat-containing protein [Acidobacteria bacterium AH-259-A15]|nr:FG-GAP-like repeat-containing protein [Acidobacteria bacterium AH-259-A15]
MFTAVVKNIGVGPATASILEFIIADELPGAPGTQFAVPALATGDSFAVQRQASLAVDNYTNTATADITGVVAESDETNNVTTDSFTVTLYTVHTITTAADGATWVYAADVDGDGDVDGLSASFEDDTIAWYENTAGDGLAWIHRTISSTADGARSVFSADVDGDGDLDVLSASLNNDTIAWYENTNGDGSIWFPRTISSTADAAASVYAADVDRDGDMDALSASINDDKIAWYENTNGDGSIWLSHIISTTADFAVSVFAADVDSDGDVDALSASIVDNTIAWYENTNGDGSIWTEHAIAAVAGTDPRSVFAADVDGDGDLDALSASTLDNTVAWYENTSGDGTSWTTHTITNTAAGAVSVCAADVDGDGDLDALSTSTGDSTVAWYENTNGDGLTWSTQTITTAASVPLSVFAADVDGDLDLDILSASGLDDTVAWYENPVDWPEETITTMVDSPRSLFAADVDGDGDLDTLSASFDDATIAWHENTQGDGSAWALHTITNTAVGASDVFAADMDGDGDIDAISAATAGDAIAWYENPNNVVDPWAEHVIATPDNPTSVFAADVDGDGDIDALATLIDTTLPSVDTIVWYENPNNLLDPWPEHVITDITDNPMDVFAADVDGDGDMDALSAAFIDDTIAWYENTDGIGGTWDRHIITIDPNFARLAESIFAADVDGDGDLDALSTNRFQARVAWHENTDGIGGSWISHTITTGTPLDVFAADIDSDGDVDALSAFNTSMVWHENTLGNGSAWTSRTIPTTNTGFIASVFAADVDGDGDLDALSAATADDTITWHENRSPRLPVAWEARKTISGTANGPIEVIAADVDRDGDLDALSTSTNDDTVAWHENTNGDGSFWAPVTISSSALGAQSVFAADVDGDGDLDALSASLTDGTIAWHDNTGGDGSLWATNFIATADGAVSVIAADVDGDGDLDALAAATLVASITWYENSSASGDGSTWTPHTIATVNGAASVVTADVDGDGDLDAIFAHPHPEDRKIVWYENAGVEPWPAHTITIIPDVDNPQQVVAADVDGDGDIDALAADRNADTVTWYENTAGDGSAWTTHTIASAAGAKSVFAADVDSDGDIDALSASRDDGTIAWYENTSGDGSTWATHKITTAAGDAIWVFAADVDGDGDLDALSASQFDDTVAWYENTAK